KSTESVTRCPIHLVDHKSSASARVVLPGADGWTFTPLPFALARGHPRPRNLARREVLGTDESLRDSLDESELECGIGLAGPGRTVKQHSAHPRVQHVSDVTPTLPHR